MQFAIKGTPYRVVAVEQLDSADPDDVGWISRAKAEIQILRSQSLPAAFRTLAHEVVHAWLGLAEPPATVEHYCEDNAAQLVAFYDEMTRQGGLPALAELMGLPFEGDFSGLAASGVSLAGLDGAALHAAVVRHVHAWNLSDDLFAIYRAQYEAAGLEPMLGDCYPRVSFDRDARCLKVEVGTTLKAIRRIAERTGQRGGCGPWEWCGEAGEWRDTWPKSLGKPAVARTYVTRIDRPGEKFWGVAHWDEYAQSVEIDGVVILTRFWRDMPAHMLAKCAETLAYARAFVQVEGLFIDAQVRDESATRLTREQQGAVGRRSRPRDLPAIGSRPPIEEQLRRMREEAGDDAPPVATLADGGVSVDYDVEPDHREPWRPPGGGPDARYHDAIERSVHNTTFEQRQAMIDELRDEAGTFEDDNPEGFGNAIVEEARKRWGRRRRQ